MQLQILLKHSPVGWHPVLVLSFAVLLVVNDANWLVPHVFDRDHSSRAAGSVVGQEIDPLPSIAALGVCYLCDFAGRAAQQATFVGDEDLVENLDTTIRRPGPDREPLSSVHCEAIKRVNRCEAYEGRVVLEACMDHIAAIVMISKVQSLLDFGQNDLGRRRGTVDPSQTASDSKMMK